MNDTSPFTNNAPQSQAIELPGQPDLSTAYPVIPNQPITPVSDQLLPRQINDTPGQQSGFLQAVVNKNITISNNLINNLGFSIFGSIAYTHNLGYIPICIAYGEIADKYGFQGQMNPLPHIQSNTGSVQIALDYLITKSTITFSITINDSTQYTPYIQANIRFTLFSTPISS